MASKRTTTTTEDKVDVSLNEYNVKATACIMKVQRTFIFTFVLVFLTLCLMYSTTEHFSTSLTIFKNMTSLKRQVSTNSNLLRRIITKQGNQTFVSGYNNDSYITENEPNIRKYVPNSETKIQNNISNIGLPTEKSETEVITVSGSKEFPGMPDPCVSPRRKTGVEDILCMKKPDYLPEYKNPCWMDGTTFRCLPYFHLIGICKSGTSDFFKRLLLHPDILPNRGIFGKEIWYWSWKRFAIKDRAGKLKLGMTLKEFTMQFDTNQIRTGVDSEGRHNRITGHGDPMDIWDRFREQDTPQNTPGAEELLWTTPYAVRHINPNVRLILMLRDPIDRLYSHYFHGGYGKSAQSFHSHVVQSIDLWKTCLQQHTVRHCIYAPDMKKSLRAPIYTSFYIVHLREWLKAFPREQLFIFRNEDYSSDIKSMMKKIFAFLDVSVPDDSILEDMKNLPHFYETKGKKAAGPMLPSTREILKELYRPYTEELAAFLKDQKFAFKDKSFAR